MPELPDVESFRAVLASHAVGKPIERVDVLDAQVLHGISARKFSTALRHKRFEPPSRYGKWLVVPVAGSDDPVMLHFGMTGSLLWSQESGRHKHDRVVFVFSHGELSYRDMRKLTGIRVGTDALRGLGPDALAVSQKEFRSLLAGKRGQVKPVLVDQSEIAGLGNLLADEILWRARINPRRKCAQLGDADFSLMYKRMGSVLRQSVKDGRVPPRKNWLTGRRDEPSGSCPRCGTTLSRGRVGGRGTVWCPNCQPD